MDKPNEASKLYIERLSDLATSAAYGSGDLVAELFRAEGFAAPEQIWRPTENELSLPELIRFYGFLNRSIAVSQRMSMAEFEDLDLSDFEKYLIILDPIDGYDDFIYRHYGSHIASVRGLDMTGRRASEFGGHISLYFRTIYQSVAARKDWILTKHVPPRNIFAHRWRRLIVPILNDQGNVCKFLVANVPENELRAGLDRLSNAVLITNERKEVVFANQEAQTVFGALHPGQRETRLADYMVSDITDNLSDQSGPEPIVTQFEAKGIVGGTLIVNYTIIVNPISFRGETYSLLMLLPES